MTSRRFGTRGATAAAVGKIMLAHPAKLWVKEHTKNGALPKVLPNWNHSFATLHARKLPISSCGRRSDTVYWKHTLAI